MTQNNVTRIALAAASLWLSAAAPLPAAQSAAASNRVDQVIVVFKTHFDIGYTDMASNVVQRYRTTMIDQALKVVDQNRDLPPEQQFVWTLPGWPMKKILEDWPGQTPDAQAARAARRSSTAGSWSTRCRSPRTPSCWSRRTWCAAWASPRSSPRQPACRCRATPR